MGDDPKGDNDSKILKRFVGETPADSPQGIQNEVDAIVTLNDMRGSIILEEEWAGQISDVFDITLAERPGQLEPISRLDRIQPYNDNLGIGVGSLCYQIASQHPACEAEDYVAGGHGMTQRKLKELNLKQIVDGLFTGGSE